MKFANDSDKANKCVNSVKFLGRRTLGREVAEDLQGYGYKITTWMASHILIDDPRVEKEWIGGRYCFTAREQK